MKIFKILFVILYFSLNANAEIISLVCSTNTFYIIDNENNVEKGEGGEDRYISIDLSNGFIEDNLTKYSITKVNDILIKGSSIESHMASATIEFNRYTGNVKSNYPLTEGGRVKVNGLCEKVEKKF